MVIAEVRAWVERVDRWSTTGSKGQGYRFVDVDRIDTHLVGCCGIQWCRYPACNRRAMERSEGFVAERQMYGYVWSGSAPCHPQWAQHEHDQHVHFILDELVDFVDEESGELPDSVHQQIGLDRVARRSRQEVPAGLAVVGLPTRGGRDLHRHGDEGCRGPPDQEGRRDRTDAGGPHARHAPLHRPSGAHLQPGARAIWHFGVTVRGVRRSLRGRPGRGSDPAAAARSGHRVHPRH